MIAFIRGRVGAGHGWPTREMIAAAMKWRHVSSAGHALRRAEALGLIRRVGHEARAGGESGAGKAIWELTALGSAPTTTYCRGCVRTKPASSFFRSPHHADGLTPNCRDCIIRNAEAGRRDRAARRAARVAAP
jgi:hypothetical protein